MPWASLFWIFFRTQLFCPADVYLLGGDETVVTKAGNLSLFMVNLVGRLLQDFRQHQGEVSVLNLKAHCRGANYVEETIKMLPEMPEPVLLERIFAKIVGLGRIHAPPADLVPA